MGSHGKTSNESGLSRFTHARHQASVPNPTTPIKQLKRTKVALALVDALHLAASWKLRLWVEH